MSNRQVTFGEIDASLTRCMKEQPPQGIELTLHVDANRMAGLWSKMLLERVDVVDAAGLKPEVLEAIERWRPVA